jgi:hypothetical protein
VTFSALLTLFVVPACYALLARNTRSPQYVSRAIARLRRAGDAPGISGERAAES